MTLGARQVKHSVEECTERLRRLIDFPPGREWLGITVRNVDQAKVPFFDRDPEFVVSLLSRIFSDINAQKVDTRSLNKAQDIEDYFDALPDDLHPDDTPRDLPQSFRGAVVPNAAGRPRLNKTTAAATKKDKTVKTSPPRAS